MRELRVALVGGGFMGRAHSMAYALAPIAEDSRVRLVKEVLVDADAEVASVKSRELGWNRSLTDWREVIADPDIDIVDICTPPPSHEEIATAAMKAGKHVFCEKPLANDADQAERMWQVARGSGVRAQVGFNYRHTPAVAFIKELLSEGRLGRPLQFRASYLQETAFGADPHRWRASRASGGSGMVGDIGSHIIDIAEYLLGEITSVSARVRAKGEDIADGWQSESERLEKDLVDDGGVWIAELPDGVLGSFSVNSFASGSKNRIRFELDGTKGAVAFDWNDRDVCRVSYVDESPTHRGFRSIHMDSSHPNGWWRIGGLGTGYVEIAALQMLSFVRAIVNESDPAPDFRAAAHVQRVVDAVGEAAGGDGWVDVRTVSDEGGRR